jgi:UDP-4-amino-4,6-dideoxy-N-acetyl-beta-L-altrosamine N-acetyltransferase
MLLDLLILNIMNIFVLLFYHKKIIKMVTLKRLKEKHLELVRSWRNNPKIQQYMYSSNYISEEDQIKWFNSIKNDHTKLYYVIHYDDIPVGVVNLTNIDIINKKCSWGLYIGDMSFRGKGIASAVEQKIFHKVFNKIKLNRLEGEVFADNTNVIKLHEKNGFKKEGYHEQYVIKDGEYRDVISIALLKKDWLNGRI